MLADFLIVDVSKPYSETTFLEIEKAALAGRDRTTSGGRSPNDDAMKALYGFLINGGHGPDIDDGVRQPSKAASDAFPYLVAPGARREQPPRHTSPAQGPPTRAQLDVERWGNCKRIVTDEPERSIASNRSAGCWSRTLGSWRADRGLEPARGAGRGHAPPARSPIR